MTRSPLVHFILISIVVFGAIFGLRTLRLLEAMELRAYDFTLKILPHQRRVKPPITIVEITDQDIREVGHWPLTDADLAKSLSRLTAFRPRVIGVDIYRDLSVPPGQHAFEELLRRHPEIVMVMKFGKIEDGGIPAPRTLQETNQVGFSDVLVDPGGIVRRGLLFMDDGETFFVSFPLLLAMKYLEEEDIRPAPALSNPEWLKLGQMVYQPLNTTDGAYQENDARGYQFLLNLDRGNFVFDTVSLSNVFKGNVPAELISDKIVLVGVKAQGVKDYFFSSQCGLLITCPSLAGIELHGLVIDQLLRSAHGETIPIVGVPELFEQGWIALWVIAGGIVGGWLHGAWRFPFMVIIGVILILAVAVAGIAYGYWIPLIPPALGWIATSTITMAYVTRKEKNERRFLMSIFSRHVSSAVAENLWQNREQFVENGRLRPQSLKVTTLFSDLEGFTTVGEKLEPNILLDWLNTYMEAMVKTVFRHHGVVDDYHGDMIKADFGVPQARQRHEEIQRDAENAVRCALAMRDHMRNLNKEWQEQGLPMIRLRVGINTGFVVAGSLGGQQRLKFTTIGDSVNIAARLESYDKEDWGLWEKDEVCRILIGEGTRHYIGDQWNLKEVGFLSLKGKQKQIAVFQVVLS